MPKQKRSHPFGSALLGGALVAVVGLLAVATGLVSTGGGTTTTRTASAATASDITPAASIETDEGGNTVNEDDNIEFITDGAGSGAVPTTFFADIQIA